jgi:hypothetical protein
MNYTNARLGAERGMNQAVDHANRVAPNWSTRAYEKLFEYAWLGNDFMTEDVRLWAEQTGLDSPPDNRSWGAVINKAVRANLIERVGYGNSKTGHMRPMPIWRKSHV